MKKKDVASATDAEFDAALAGATPMLRLERRSNNRPAPDTEPEPMALGLLSDLWPDFAAELEHRADGRFDPIQTGLKELDAALEGGFHRGGTTLLSAAPGVGKTTIMLFIGLNQAKQGTPVIFWSLELTRNDALARLVSIIEGQPWGEIRRGLHPGPVKLAGEHIHELPFAVHGADTCPTVETMEELVTRLTALYGKSPLLIVDYAQLLLKELEVEERSGATAISKHIAALAGRTGAAVVAISAVGRAAYNVMGRKGKPDLDRVLGMAKESGQFEYDAAAVLALVPVQEEEPDRYKRLWAVVGKARYGCPGRMVPLKYDGMAGRWCELSPEEMPAAVGKPKVEPDILRETIIDLVSRKPDLTSGNAVAQNITGRYDRTLAMLKAMRNAGELRGGEKKEPFTLTGLSASALTLAKFRELYPNG